MFTREEVSKKWATADGKYEVAQVLARHWWDGMDLDDAGEAFVDSTIEGCSGLLLNAEEEIIDALEQADLLEEGEDEEE